jgi:hypothetical protein
MTNIQKEKFIRKVDTRKDKQTKQSIENQEDTRKDRQKIDKEGI